MVMAGAVGRGRLSAPVSSPARELAALLVAEAVSTAGDQLARVALAVLVYGRTRSPALTAAVLAVSLLPWVVAAPLLSGLGDRLPKRAVLVSADLYRAGVCALLALPGLPTGVLLVVVFALTCGEPPFRSARQALYSEAFTEPDAYTRATSLIGTATTAANFAGYGAGGILVAALGSRPALLADAASFALSGLLLRLLLAHRPAATPGARSGSGASAASVVWRTPAARAALCLAVTVTAFDAVSVGLAVPWAHQLGGGTDLVGFLLAAGLGGATCGFALVGRVRGSEARSRLLLPCTVAVFLPLVVLFAVHGRVAALVVLAVSGVFTASQVISQQAFAAAVPAERRAGAFGLAFAVINLAQGATVALAGVLAERVHPQTVIAAAGVLGLVVTAALTGLPRGDRPPERA